MGSSAVLRRWLSNSGILRSRKSGFSMCFRANHGGGGDSQAVSGPLLLLPPSVDEKGNVTQTFYCPARNEYSIKRNKMDEVQLAADTKCVGSSHGWLAFSDRSKKDHLFLSNPTTGRSITLPRSIGTADRLFLSDDMTAFMVYGWPGRLAFCRPGRDGGWTVLGRVIQDHRYENILYSAKHNRLFCLCYTTYSRDVTLECWNFEYPDGTLDWVVEDDQILNLGSAGFTTMNHLKKKCTRISYLVSDEHSGDLFLVVRHVNPHAGGFGIFSVAEKFDKDEEDLTFPYKTVDFDVYKIDSATREVMHMERDLQGLAMFVGINHPFAIPALAAGLKPDSIYFTDENRLADLTKEEINLNYGGHDNGIFDHVNRDFSACCDFYPIEYHKIRRLLPPPLWLAPTPPHPTPPHPFD